MCVASTLHKPGRVDVQRCGSASALRAARPAHRHHVAQIAWSHREIPLCFLCVWSHALQRFVKLGMPSVDTHAA